MATLSLPGGGVLGTDEKIVRSEEMAVSLVLFFLKTKVAVTNNRLVGQWPSTFLGLVPVGSNSSTYPLTNVASVAVGTGIAVWSLIIGFILLSIGLSDGNAWLLAVIGICLVANAFPASFEVTNNAGQKIGHHVAIFEKGKAQAFANEINTAIANMKR